MYVCYTPGGTADWLMQEDIGVAFKNRVYGNLGSAEISLQRMCHNSPQRTQSSTEMILIIDYQQKTLWNSVLLRGKKSFDILMSIQKQIYKKSNIWKIEFFYIDRA